MQVDQIPSNLQTLIKNSIFSLDHDTGINCDGSFRLFQENTSVTCSIYGPRESVVQKRSYEKGNVEVQIKQFQDLAIKELRYYEQRIRLFLEDIIILDKYPRNLLTFVLIIHNDDGSLLSALMNSCMLALLFNGIALKQTIWTVDITILEEKNSRFLHLYPSKAKGKVGANSVHIGLDLVQSNVATFDTEGLLDEDLFESVYQISSELVPVLRQSIKRYIAEIVFE